MNTRTFVLPAFFVDYLTSKSKDVPCRKLIEEWLMLTSGERGRYISHDEQSFTAKSHGAQDVYTSPHGYICTNVTFEAVPAVRRVQINKPTTEQTVIETLRAINSVWADDSNAIGLGSDYITLVRQVLALKD